MGLRRRPVGPMTHNVSAFSAFDDETSVQHLNEIGLSALADGQNGYARPDAQPLLAVWRS
jgi:hypothetical protein